MDIEAALEARRPTLVRSANRPKPSGRDLHRERTNNGLMLQTMTPIFPMEHVWVQSLGRYLELKEVVTRSAVGAVLQARSLAVLLSEELLVVHLYELVCVSCLLSMNCYRYPQVVVVVKQDRHMQELHVFLQKQYGCSRQPLNCLNSDQPLTLCLASRFADLQVHMPTTTLLVLFGDFQEAELKKFISLKPNLIAVLPQSKSTPSLQTMFSCTLVKMPSRLIAEFEKQYDLHNGDDVIGFEESEQELFLVLLALQRKNVSKLVVFTQRSNYSRIKGLLQANFPAVRVDDTDRLSDFKTDGWHVLGYGMRLQLPIASYERLILFLKENDLSLLSDHNVSIMQSSNCLDYSNILHDDSPKKLDVKPTASVRSPTLFSKKSQPSPIVQAVGLQVPLTLVELQYNRTWVRLITERNLQVFPPIVVMHIDYLKISQSMINNLPAEKRNDSVIYLGVSKGLAHKSVIVRSHLTKEILDGIMEKTARLRQKERDIVSMGFCECPPIDGAALLQSLNTCQQLNDRDPLQLILLLFEDNKRFVECLARLVGRP